MPFFKSSCIRTKLALSGICFHLIYPWYVNWGGGDIKWKTPVVVELPKFVLLVRTMQTAPDSENTSKTKSFSKKQPTNFASSNYDTLIDLAKLIHPVRLN